MPNAGFSLLGGMGESPPPAENVLIPPYQKSIPPLKQQFSSYKPIKTAFLAVVIAPAPVIENNKKIILMIISVI